MKNRLKVIFITFIAILLVSGCSGDGTGASSEKERGQILSTGTTTGVFYQLGALLSTMWTNELDQQVLSQGSNGSVDNLNLMRQGEVTMGFSTVNVIYEAYNGVGSFEGNKYEDIRILANLYPNVSHVIALENAGIDSIEDISGKSFVFGAPGSATEIESGLLLESHGVNLDNVDSNYVGFTEAVDLLRNNQVDAVNIYTGVPSSAATELISTVDSKIINFSEEGINKLTDESKYPWNLKHVIEAGTYDNQEKDVVTVGQFAGIAVDANVSEEVVYELTKALWENVDELEDGHAIAQQFDPALAVEGTADVPLHPGAEKYYKEIGVLE
ncbi:TAXI family TRAP transporter solute-binding subunit [Oceanobacillus senegalensis]|uniref:TAXI family TRAP transporter solute-binding subunit n=1 Tax=Oceanobacillus senegalensis TaxID=1936063 RepID=UPI000A312695|nr:TAXI family TRAP transporter solute-binding subunit [Oceanobacillus senegalensis]